MGTPITLSELLASVDAQLEAGVPPGVRPAAAFDADGTLWAGDIGEAAFQRGFDAGLVLPETVAGPVRAWAARHGMSLPDEPAAAFARLTEALCEDGVADGRAALGDAFIRELYAMQAWCFAGQRCEKLQAFAQRCFDEDAVGIFPAMAELVPALHARGIEVLVVSASLRSLVLPGAARLGVPPERVFGTLPPTDEAGRFLPTATALYDEHKRAAIASFFGDDDRPLLAFGDSVAGTDRALLACAERPVAVNPSGRHLAAAEADPRCRLLFV